MDIVSSLRLISYGDCVIRNSITYQPICYTHNTIDLIATKPTLYLTGRTVLRPDLWVGDLLEYWCWGHDLDYSYFPLYKLAWSLNCMFCFCYIRSFSVRLSLQYLCLFPSSLRLRADDWDCRFTCLPFPLQLLCSLVQIISILCLFKSENGDFTPSLRGQFVEEEELFISPFTVNITDTYLLLRELNEQFTS